MSAIIIDGKATAEKIHQQLAGEVKSLADKKCFPRLEVVLVGEDPASGVYVGMKQKACDKVGIISNTTRLPAETPQDELLALVRKFNDDAGVHGILVQLPLPKHISEEKIIEAISPEKDVDGFLQHPFFIAYDNVRCFEIDKSFETIVTINHAAIQIIEV